MADELDIATFCLGDWQTNCYVVRSAGASRCWLIDAGFEPEPMLRHVAEAGLEPQRVVLTHAHVDHIAGLAAVRERWPRLPILLHEAEQAFPGDPRLNLSAAVLDPVVAPAPSGTVAHDEVLDLDGHRFQVRHTPGHSPGGITLVCAAEGVAFVGDALFEGSIGRTDFPTSDHARLMASIRDQLLTLPNATRVLPGHGPPTTVGAERRGNPFLAGVA